MTSTLYAAIQFFFHRTLWLMMMYYQTKFGCHGINSSENTVERVIFDHMSPRCDLDLEDSDNNYKHFLHDTLAHDAASPYQI